MSDIFVSYSSENRDRVLPLIRALEKTGRSIFWDRTIPTGKTWRQVIHSEIQSCRSVLVVWTEQSVNSEWVQEEAEIGKRRKILFPVLLDNVEPPFGFGSIQAEDLSSWDSAENFPAFQKLVRDLETFLGPARTAALDKAPRSASDSATSEAKQSVTNGRVFQDTLKDGSRGPEMVVVPAGEFQMGDVQGNGRANEQPVHTVRIKKPFAIGRYPITFVEYDRFASATNRELPGDEGWGRGRQPVINISWSDTVEYANWLCLQTGKRYRLSNEAEWEYAARAGTDTAYWWGEQVQHGMANFRGSDSRWGGKQASPVGSFSANPFGLYDMAGNVWEWVQDCWQDTYDGAPTDGSAWEEKNVVQRVRRGGSWDSIPDTLRSSYRTRYDADNSNYRLGFRLAQDLR